jgi:hypothetical protein
MIARVHIQDRMPKRERATADARKLQQSQVATMFNFVAGAFLPGS